MNFAIFQCKYCKSILFDEHDLFKIEIKHKSEKLIDDESISSMSYCNQDYNGVIFHF